MSYTLRKSAGPQRGGSLGQSLGRLRPVLSGEGRRVTTAFVSLVVTSGASLAAPLIIGRTVDTYIRSRDFGGVVRNAEILMAAYVAGMAATYVQSLAMGSVGRNVLFALRNAIFMKLQDLPLDFFNQNKAGDLISRI